MSSDLSIPKPTLQCPCNGSHLQNGFVYEEPPVGETQFDLGSRKYRRGYECCRLCGHWFAVNEMAIDGLYEGNYVASTYGERLRSTFDRIVSLPSERSDNAGRITRIQEFAHSHFPHDKEINVLDIGAGIGIFPHSVKKVGWNCTAIDPDPQAVKHIREYIGVKAIQGDFMEVKNLGRFDIVTLNKVLEHISDPVAMLVRAREFLVEEGFVYVEVPDGEMAARKGKEREEFFIEHLHVFSLASTVQLATRAGFDPLLVERLQEPSTKFALRAFIVPGAQC